MRRKTNPKEKRERYYHISDVSRMYNLHPQTLRLYEREGLLRPSRSRGNTRLYTDKDLKELEVILNLIRDLGVNLAGVEVILNMRRKMELIEADMNAFLEYLRESHFRGREEEFDRKRLSLVRLDRREVVKVDDKG